MRMKLPAQIDKITQNRTASAPYNFVPLPEKVVCAVEGSKPLPDHNSYGNEEFPHSGYFEVSLTTMSPLYIRGPVPSDEFARQDDHAKNGPDFFYTKRPDQPVIPGSSLRGMLRSLLEIAGYGKMQGVSDRKLFFRSVGTEAVGRYYTNSIGITSERNITRGYGFARLRERGEWEIEECDAARVKMSLVASKFGNGQTDPDRALYTKPGPAGVPLDSIQHQQVLVTLESPDSWGGRGESTELPRVEALRKTTEPAPSTRERIGTLVLTGPMTGKKKAFVFMPRRSGLANSIEIPNDREALDENDRLLERFNNDQMTRWQKDAFPPIKTGPPGALRDGDPVFYIIENGRLVFFGRAFLFRLPYQNSPLDMVPEELRNPDEIDYAEALFGFVKTKSQPASRIAVTDASLEKGQSEIWLSENPIIPRILSTPKPSTIQHYLVQRAESKERLAHFGDSPLEKTVIRGFKRYWHQGLGKGMSVDEIRKAIAEKAESLKGKGDSDEDTQHTSIKPLRQGISFRFRVYFNNLSDRELGAICWILQPPGDEAQNYCHHLGMGKPLGLGAVKLESRLIRTNRKSRYGGLFDQEGWLTGSDQECENLADRPTLEKLTESFERHILAELKLDQQCQRLRELKRIGMLLKTMEWPGFRPDPDGPCYLDEGRPNTRYMSINNPKSTNERNEFRDRPVLPSPAAAFGKLTGEVEPDIKLAMKQKPVVAVISESRPVKSISEIEAGESEWIRLAIKSLKLPGEVNKVEDLFKRIEALTIAEHRISCAKTLHELLVKISLKEKHKEKPWWKSLNTILGEQ
jgi:CRISPR-associated protein (TIGR03986 family)